MGLVHAAAVLLLRVGLHHPRRFNPDREAWLPVLHTTRDGLRFTALFSNTQRAHQLGATRDWVVIYWGHDHQESQCTVVTETRGPLEGHRVVRGREAECARYHGGKPSPRPAPPRGRGREVAHSAVHD